MNKILVKYDTNLEVVPKQMHDILETFYRYYDRDFIQNPKTPMIKILRTLSMIRDPKNYWSLKETKEYVEANWEF